jgi:hypothetical protein
MTRTNNNQVGLVFVMRKRMGQRLPTGRLNATRIRFEDRRRDLRFEMHNADDSKCYICHPELCDSVLSGDGAQSAKR